jgi:membrane protein DedA with SNARE-associated domain
VQDLLSNIARWSIDVVYSFGYVGVAVLSLLSSLNLPIPIPLVLALAGFLVGQGSLSFVSVVTASTAGAVAAALVLYLLGLWFGETRLRRLIRRAKRFGLVSESDLDKASRGFERHGGKAILISHLLPVGGGLISIPAGLKRMPIRWFTLYTVLGCTLWNGTFVILGWALGAQWDTVQGYASIVERATLIALAGVVLWFLRGRWKARNRPGP